MGAHPQASGWREAVVGVRNGKQGRERLQGRSRRKRSAFIPGLGDEIQFAFQKHFAAVG